MEERICAFCNKPFVPCGSTQRYCKRPHYMTCPVCGKEYLVTNNENLKRPPVACSYACRRAKANQTCLEKYGNKCAANGEEQRKLADATMIAKYGAKNTLQSAELVSKCKKTLLDRYGVDHPMRINEISEAVLKSREAQWRKTIITEFPMKIEQQPFSELEPIDEDKMSVYVLVDKQSVEFLKENGHRIKPKWGKTHRSLGLVYEKEVYQVLRFEKCRDEIILADFGTKQGYFNPNSYTKLMNCAISVLNIDSFTCVLPRSLASLELTYSLSLQLIERGIYEVYWKLNDNKLKKLTIRDNIPEMKQKFDYITSDYLDMYKYVPQQGRNESILEELFAQM